jgi:hypothetical protein
MEVSGQIYAPTALTPGKDPGIYWIGDWVGSRTGLDVLEKRRISCPCRDSNPGPSSPYPSHYTDWASPAPILRSDAKC